MKKELLQAGDGAASRVFVAALQVMNESIAANEERFPYKQIFQAAERLVVDAHFGVAVYEEDPAWPVSFFTLQLSEKRIKIVHAGIETRSIVWQVPLRYLERVVNNPRVYIDHPEKLDWDWLKLRLGLG